MKVSLLLTVLLIVSVMTAAADSTDVPAARQADTVLFQPKPLASASAAVTNPVDFEKHLTQNPTVALFKSMLVPGWGQIGNRRYVKALVIAGLEAWFIGSVIHYGRQASDFRQQWYEATDITSRNVYYGLYEDRRDERNKFSWFAGIVVFLSMFDAYVDAHLSGSPSQERNSRFGMDVMPRERGGANALLTYRF